MFLVGRTVEAPRLLWGLRTPSHGGGSDGLAYLFEEYELTKKAIPESACEDDDGAEDPDDNAGAEEDLINCDLITLPLKDGAILNSFMPGCKSKETVANRCAMNRAAMAEQLAYESADTWPDDFVPAWPRVKQKLLDKNIYDGSDRLLRSGSHVPLAMATIAPGQRSTEKIAERKVAKNKRKAQKDVARYKKAQKEERRDGGSSDHAAVAAWQPSASSSSSSSWQSSAASSSSAPVPPDAAADDRFTAAMSMVSPATREMVRVSAEGSILTPLAGRRPQSRMGRRSQSQNDHRGGRTWNWSEPGRSASASSARSWWRGADQQWTGPGAQSWEPHPYLFCFRGRLNC